MYQLCNKVCTNRIMRIIIIVLLVAVFFVVPIEHKMLEAEASFTAAAAISVICAVLVAMGFTFGRVFLSQGIDSQFAKFSIADTVESLRKLATDIWENCPGIYGAIAACFPNGFNAFTQVRQIVQLSPYLYQIIKKYVMSKYGDSAEDIENGMNSSFIKGKPFMFNGYCFYNYTCDAAYLSGYSQVYVGGSQYGWEFLSYDSGSNLYYYRSFVRTDEQTNYRYSIPVADEGAAWCVPLYHNIYSPDSDYPFGSFDYSVRFPYVDKYGESKSGYEAPSYVRLSFTSQEEYENAVYLSAGNVLPGGANNSVELDSDTFDSAISSYPQYVYIHENVDDYVGVTASEIAAPAYSEVYDSNVVDNVSRAVTWQGDRTLCPIDELEGSIPASVIGHWVATWDETSTLCNISCYAEDGTLTWSGEVATTLTWADVIARLGDIAITGPIAGTIAGTAVGSFAAADAALDFEPLKIAGETFSKKFPFCLPFDLYRAFKQFDYDTSAQAPVYEIPLNFGERFGTHYIVLDMSKWTPVANIVKWTVYVSFMLSLIVVTKKVMGGD